MAQGTPKKGPRGPQEVPKKAAGGPKDAPRRTQEVVKRPARHPKWSPRKVQGGARCEYKRKCDFDHTLYEKRGFSVVRAFQNDTGSDQKLSKGAQNDSKNAKIKQIGATARSKTQPEPPQRHPLAPK